MQQTNINGNRYSFTNINVAMANYAFGQVTLGGLLELPKGIFKSVNYDAQQEPGIVQGNQIAIVGRTQGYGTATGSFEMLVSDMDDFFLSLSFGGTFPIMSVDFVMTVQYSVNDFDVRQDLLQGCRISKIGSANQQGTDATTKTCDITIARLQLNGIDAFADPSI